MYRVRTAIFSFFCSLFLSSTFLSIECGRRRLRRRHHFVSHSFCWWNQIRSDVYILLLLVINETQQNKETNEWTDGTKKRGSATKPQTYYIERNEQRPNDIWRPSEKEMKWCHFFVFCSHCRSPVGIVIVANGNGANGKPINSNGSFCSERIRTGDRSNWMNFYFVNIQNEFVHEWRERKTNLPIEKHGNPLISAPNIWLIAKSRSPTSKHPT